VVHVRPPSLVVRTRDAVDGRGLAPRTQAFYIIACCRISIARALSLVASTLRLFVAM